MNKKVLFVIIIGQLIFSINSFAQSKEFNLDDGLAIEGYDPVAYQVQKKALEGKNQFKAAHGGVTYKFISTANKDLFLQNPQKYVPQYGGWCAYAMGAKGEKVSVDPETFKIINGKLYLFYNSWGNNTLPKWNKDESRLKISADKSWAAIIK